MNNKKSTPTFENIKVFDGFTFWTFGQIFEAIFYKKKVAHQVFDDGFTFQNFGRIFEAIFYKKKVAHQVFEYGCTFWNFNTFFITFPHN